MNRLSKLEDKTVEKILIVGASAPIILDASLNFAGINITNRYVDHILAGIAAPLIIKQLTLTRKRIAALREKFPKKAELVKKFDLFKNFFPFTSYGIACLVWETLEAVVYKRAFQIDQIGADMGAIGIVFTVNQLVENVFKNTYPNE